MPGAARARRSVANLTAAWSCLLLPALPACAAEPHYAFAVISSVIRGPADEPAAQRLIQAIGLDGRLAFLVYDGNLKGADERCADALYDRRAQWLQGSTIPLVVVPGRHDWADCATSAGGGYDAAERLDFLRQTMFADTASLGKPTLALTRESDVARFHAFRENVRWVASDTVFVGLDVVGGNNHYSDAGGRNGEFDDRAIASAFWLEHAAEYAKRRGAKALVVFMEADPNFSRYEEHVDRFAWLRFARRRRRDGYLEFKRSLVNAAQTFRGPVIVVHRDAHTLPGGFAIDQPLYNDKGIRVDNLTRVAIASRDATTQWILFDVNFGRQAPFRVSVRTVPKDLPAMPVAPTVPPPGPSSASDTSGTAIAPLPGIQYVPPAPARVPQPSPTTPPTELEPPLLPDDSGEHPAPAAPDVPASVPPPARQPAPGTGTPAPPRLTPDSMQGGGS